MKTPLEQKIIRRIKAGGRMTFEQFMALSLYDPEFGYYRSPELVIGKGGDFYTSAHLHPVFGGLIGKQIREMWEYSGSPDQFTIVEVGGGEGHICRDMLMYLENSPFFNALRYVIVEINPAMQEKQQKLLGSFCNKVRWAPSLADVGPVGCGCIFSNELLDAFPVHLVTMEEELREIYISLQGDTLTEEAGPVSSPEIAAFFDDAKIRLDRGYRTEVNLGIRDWLKDVDTVLEKGFVLTIDYGYHARDYYSEDRNRGTLICYHQHRIIEDPFQHIGLQDITCHVNFSAVRKWGEELGLRTIGWSSQGAFLVSLGIDEEIQKLAAESDDYLFELGRIKKLIMPQGMGDSHMVMVQYKGAGEPGTPNLRGFSLRNQMRHL
jgi:SAM-dependent MidA family methyltransferase